MRTFSLLSTAIAISTMAAALCTSSGGASPSSRPGIKARYGPGG